MARLTHPLEAKFEEALRGIPRPGGNGCHPALLGAANYGAMAGYTEDEIVQRIAAHIPQGDREVPEREIRDAARKALIDHALRQSGGRHSDPPGDSHDAPSFDLCRFMMNHIKAGAGTTGQHIMSVSPVPIPENPTTHARLLIETLYATRMDDYLFVGEHNEINVRPISYWLDSFQRGEGLKPHIIPNTFSGELGLKKDGKGMSQRADSCIKGFMHCVVEFDTLPTYLLRDEVKEVLGKERDLEAIPFLASWQLAFWAMVQLPVVALIDSGGKSIHAWLKVEDCPDNACWEQTIEKRLYSDFLIPLGVDPACRNESRLSRLPGYYRAEKGRHQRLLYLNPEGRPVCES